MQATKHTLTEEEVDKVVEMTQGYSSADLITLIREVAMMPVREIPTEKLLEIKDMNEIRAASFEDFKTALRIVSPSVSPHTIAEFDLWRREKG